MVKPVALWSRPRPPFWLTGVRPNSAPQTTSVSSIRPVRFRSFKSAAMGLSVWPHIFSWLPFRSSWASHCMATGLPPE